MNGWLLKRPMLVLLRQSGIYPSHIILTEKNFLRGPCVPSGSRLYLQHTGSNKCCIMFLVLNLHLKTWQASDFWYWQLACTEHRPWLYRLVFFSDCKHHRMGFDIKRMDIYRKVPKDLTQVRDIFTSDREHCILTIAKETYGSLFKILLNFELTPAVLWIRDILVRIQIRGSIPLVYWSVSGDCFFRWQDANKK